MGKPGAFLDIDRAASKLRPISQRVRDFDPLYKSWTRTRAAPRPAVA